MFPLIKRWHTYTCINMCTTSWAVLVVLSTAPADKHVTPCTLNCVHTWAVHRAEVYTTSQHPQTTIGLHVQDQPSCIPYLCLAVDWTVVLSVGSCKCVMPRQTRAWPGGCIRHRPLHLLVTWHSRCCQCQHRLQVNLHMSLVCIITIGPASSSSLGGRLAPPTFLNSQYLFLNKKRHDST